ncbi:MAG: hypothetical protein WD602_03060 [Actinomycetota bacterium]
MTSSGSEWFGIVAQIMGVGFLLALGAVFTFIIVQAARTRT